MLARAKEWLMAHREAILGTILVMQNFHVLSKDVSNAASGFLQALLGL